MFFTSKSSTENSDHFWLSLTRISVGFMILPSLLLNPLTAVDMKPSMIVTSTLFLCWGVLAACGHKFWQRPLQVAKVTAFIDLAFSAIIIIFCHILSLSWLPALFLLPTLELISLYGMAGAVFGIITYAWTIIFVGLISVSLVQQPLWWITVFLWGALLILTATLQTIRLWYMRYIPSSTYIPQFHFIQEQAQEKSLQEGNHGNVQKDRFSLTVPQKVAAFALPFQRMGVHIEEHRQEIEEAINALYSLDSNQQALSTCLHRLLQATKQNWIGLAVFSPREQEILELLLQDVTYKAMSSRLHVSPSTIKTHIYHIFQKLEVSNRDEAIRLIHQRGWFHTNHQDPLLVKV